MGGDPAEASVPPRERFHHALGGGDCAVHGLLLRPPHAAGAAPGIGTAADRLNG